MSEVTPNGGCDHQAIANVLYRYGYLIDAGDFDGIGRLFEHARMGAQGQSDTWSGREAIAQRYRETTRLYPETGTPRTKHCFSNLLIEVDASGVAATCEANYVVLQQTETLPLQPIITGRYHQRYEKHDGAWRVVEHRFFVDQVGDLSQHLLFDLARAQAADTPADD